MTLSALAEALEGFAGTGDSTFAFPFHMLHGPALSLPGHRPSIPATMRCR